MESIPAWLAWNHNGHNTVEPPSSTVPCMTTKPFHHWQQMYACPLCYLNRNFPHLKKWSSKPTWPNHNVLLHDAHTGLHTHSIWILHAEQISEVKTDNFKLSNKANLLASASQLCMQNAPTSPHILINKSQIMDSFAVPIKYTHVPHNRYSYRSLITYLRKWEN
jgi:hypothetical protein